MKDNYLTLKDKNGNKKENKSTPPMPNNQNIGNQPINNNQGPMQYQNPNTHN